MKATLSMILIVMTLTSYQAVSQPKISIIGGDTYDWGNVKPKDNPLKTTIIIKNTGNQELHITSVRPGCGCTNAPLSKDKISPNDTASVQVTLNIGANSGSVTKNITFSSNDQESHELVYYLKANVQRSLQFSPNQYLMFSDMKVGEFSETKVSIKNNSSQKIKLFDFEAPEGVFLTVGKSIEIVPGGQIEFPAKAKPTKKGYFSGVVKFKTDHEDHPTVEMQIYGSVSEPTSPVYQQNANK